MSNYLDEAATYGSHMDTGWLNFQAGLRIWLALVQVGLELGTRGSAAFEIDLGLMAPPSWRLRVGWLEVIPAIAVGAGTATIALIDESQHRARAVARQGIQADAALMFDFQFPGSTSGRLDAETSRPWAPRFLLRLALRYRAIFASRQDYSVLDQTVFPDVRIDFNSPAYTWDISCAASAGVEF